MLGLITLLRIVDVVESFAQKYDGVSLKTNAKNFLTAI
jgi:hypothetical protein